MHFSTVLNAVWMCQYRRASPTITVIRITIKFVEPSSGLCQSTFVKTPHTWKCEKCTVMSDTHEVNALNGIIKKGNPKILASLTSFLLLPSFRNSADQIFNSLALVTFSSCNWCVWFDYSVPVQKHITQPIVQFHALIKCCGNRRVSQQNKRLF